jgi:hypothetical protein
MHFSCLLLCVGAREGKRDTVQNGRAVIHRMAEYAQGEDEPVEQGGCRADGGPYLPKAGEDAIIRVP